MSTYKYDASISDQDASALVEMTEHVLYSHASAVLTTISARSSFGDEGL